MSQQGEIERCRQPCRPCPHNRNLPPRGLELARHDRLRHLVIFLRLENRVGNEAVHFPHVYRLIHRLPPATAVAGMLADSAGRGRKRVVQDHRQERIFQPVFLKKLQKAWDVHVQRAAVLARGERQFFADSRRAAVLHNVVLELAAKVSQRG